jgi:hypothetical protein
MPVGRSPVGTVAAKGPLTPQKFFTPPPSQAETRGVPVPSYIFMLGFELGSVGEFSQAGAGVGTNATVQSAIVHGGKFALRCNASNICGAIPANLPASLPFGSVRFYQYLNSLPTSTTTVYVSSAGSLSVALYSILLNSNGSLTLSVQGGGSSTSSLRIGTGQWHRFSLNVDSDNNQLSLYIDGVFFVSLLGPQSPNNPIGLSSSFQIGINLNSETATCDAFYDDIILDGQSRGIVIDPGQQVLLLPTADISRGANWKAGAGGTTNLFAAVDHIPPQGLAFASATNTSQIKNSAASLPDDYQATFQSYTAAGVPNSSLLNAVGVAIESGIETSLAANNSFSWILSNPSQSVPTVAEKFGALAITGSSPGNGWLFSVFPVASLPNGVILSQSPQASIRVGTGTATAVDVDFFGIYVDYQGQADQTHAADVDIQVDQTKLHSADTYLQTTSNITHSADADIQVSQSKSHFADVDIKADQSKSHSADVDLQVDALKVHSADLNIQVDQSRTHSADLDIQADQSKSHSADVDLQVTQSGIHFADVVIQADQSKGHFADVDIQVDQSKVHFADVAVLVDQSKAHAADVDIRVDQSLSHFADVNIQVTQSPSHSADVGIQVDQSGVHSADLYILVNQSLGHFADVVILADQSVSHAADVDIQADFSGIHAADVDLQVDFSPSHNADAYLQVSQTGLHSADVFILSGATNDLTHQADVYILVAVAVTGPTLESEGFRILLNDNLDGTTSMTAHPV